MRFLDFRLLGFAQHADTHLTFADGIPSLVIGPNESGKSQLLAGLVGTIFGMVDCQPVVPWHGDPVLLGDLHLESDGHHIQLIRHFDTSQVTVVHDGTTVYEGRGLTVRRSAEDERYQRLLMDWLGFADMDVFRRAVFVEQDQLSDDRLFRRAAEIKRLISGSREASYETAIKDLDKQLNQLKQRPRKHNAREIEQLEAEIGDLEQRATQAARFEQEAIELDELEESANVDLTRLRDRRNALSALLEMYGEHRQLRDETERQNENVTRATQDLRHVTESMKRRAALEHEMTSLDVPGDPDLDAARQDRFERRHLTEEQRTCENELADANDRVQRARVSTAHAPTPNTRTNQHGMLLVAAALIALVSIALGFLLSEVLFAGLLVAVAFALLTLRSSASSAPQHADNEQVELKFALQQAQRLQEELDRLRTQIRTIDARCGVWLSASGEPDLDHLIARLERRREAELRLAELPQVESTDVQRLESTKDELLTQAAITQRQMTQMTSQHPELLDLTPESVSRHQATLKQLDRDETQIKEQLEELKIRRGILRSSVADNAATLNITIGEKRKELQRKQRLATALELAIETMRSCVADFQEHALEPVAAQAGQLVGRITDGRYQEIAIDQESMAPTVRIDESTEIGVESLSRGTRDQIHLGIRVGLLEALSGERNMPLILDDPCVHFDQHRFDATMQVLREIARERQVIILTKDEFYLKWYRPVLRLQQNNIGRLTAEAL